MDTTIFVARALGLYFVIMAIPLLFCTECAVTNFRTAVEHKGVFLLAAVITLIIGILMILAVEDWGMSWRIVVTLFGWLTFVSGLVRLFFLDKVQQHALAALTHAKAKIAGVVTLIIGLFFLVCGFFC